MAETLRVAGIAGSLRSGSYNRMLLRETARIGADRMDVAEVEIGDLPLFDEDLETAQDYPASAARMKNELRCADALLIATPEYNYGIPGVLKNAIDWASRPANDSPLAGLPTAIIGASPAAAGTARAQLALRNAFVFTQTPVLPGPEVLVGRAPSAFDEEGRLKSSETREFLRAFVERFEEFARQLLREPAY